jgi:hypothetical protein
MTKLCKDCRWVRRYFAQKPLNGDNAYCDHPTSLHSRTPDVVTGEPRPSQQLDCYGARQEWFVDRCGPEGKYWEPPVVEVAA